MVIGITGEFGGGALLMNCMHACIGYHGWMVKKVRNVRSVDVGGMYVMPIRGVGS